MDLQFRQHFFLTEKGYQRNFKFLIPHQIQGVVDLVDHTLPVKSVENEIINKVAVPKKI